MFTVFQRKENKLWYHWYYQSVVYAQVFQVILADIISDPFSLPEPPRCPKEPATPPPPGGTQGREPLSHVGSQSDLNDGCYRLTASCHVCSAPAAQHLHYGAICCYRFNCEDFLLNSGNLKFFICSCRAFFRRSGGRKYVCIQVGRC